MNNGEKKGKWGKFYEIITSHLSNMPCIIIPGGQLDNKKM